MMTETSKSSVITKNPKPINVFYVWYAELCRRMNSNSMIRSSNPKCNTVLDFIADRLKLEDWGPVLNALKNDTSLHVISIRSRMSNCQFLQEVDSEDKARRMKRKYGALWTDYVLSSLVKSLSFSMKRTEVLTCLELDGLPLSSNYLNGILNALMENRTLKNFSLTNSPIQDSGCRSVCSTLQLVPNIEWLDLSRCDLSSSSGMYIAKLIKFQQLNRYTTSWHKSLRYSEPDSERMCGLKRITLNANPKLKDEGLRHILNELEDDLWIGALDVQKCGVTEGISDRIIDVLLYNNSLKIADFRQNDDLHPCTLERILEILKERETFEDEFHWCNSVVSIRPSVQSSRVSVTQRSLKRTETSSNIPKKTNSSRKRHPQNDALKRRFLEVKIMNTKDFVMEKPTNCGGDNKSKTPKFPPNRPSITSNVAKTLGRLKISMNPKDVPMESSWRKKPSRNGFKKTPSYDSPSCIFERIMKVTPQWEEDPEELEKLESLYFGSEVFSLDKSDLSESQASLYEFMQGLMSEGRNEKVENSKKFKSEHRYRGKKNGIR